MEHDMSPAAGCPGCGRPVGEAGCPHCAVAARVRAIDAEVAALHARVFALLGERAALLAGHHPWGPAPRPPARAGAETSRPAARTVLLLLGGGLLAVAAVAFTLLSWGRLGLGARSAVLGLSTLAVLALPVVLLRRALTVTAEVVAGVGLVLLALDAYALHRVVLPGVDGAGFAAAAVAALAGLWAGYGRLLPGLRAVPPTAVGLAQPVPLLVAVALDAGPLGYVWALLVAAVADLPLVLSPRGTAAVRRAAAVGGLLGAVPALLLAAALSVEATDVGGALEAAAPLLAGAAGLGLAGHRGAGFGTAARVSCWAGATLALLAAVGGVVRLALPSAEWQAVGYLGCAAGALALSVVLAGWAREAALGAAGAAGLVHLGALLWCRPAVTEAVLAPAGWAARVWTGVPGGPARDALGPDLAWSGGAATAAALTLAAFSAVVARRLPDADRWRSPLDVAAWAVAGAAGFAWVLASGLPYPVALAALTALVVALLAVASVTAAPGPGGVGLVLAATTGCWSLAERPATPAVLAVLGAAFAVAAWRAAPPAHRAVAGGAALLCVGGLARSLPVALGAPVTTAAFVLLAVALAAVPLAARLRPAPVSLAVECAGYAVAGWALVSAAASRGTLSAVLAGCAVGAAGVALRADRRPAAYAAAGLLVLSVWVRLAAWGVTVPEAYTAPVAVAFLGVGASRRLGDPGIPSWRAYGFGLGASLLPSLWALADDPGWVRSLLLGGWALAVTLAGARWRLRAPLLLGGGTLALVAGRELAPYVVQVAGVVPRWVPLALAGTLLLAVGATYERRLRDARSLRTAWQRLG